LDRLWSVDNENNENYDFYVAKCFFDFDVFLCDDTIDNMCDRPVTLIGINFICEVRESAVNFQKASLKILNNFFNFWVTLWV